MLCSVGGTNNLSGNTKLIFIDDFFTLKTEVLE